MTIMSQKSFAEMIGVTRQAINDLVKRGKLPAKKGKIDTTHPDCVEYLVNRLHTATPDPRKKSRADMLRRRQAQTAAPGAAPDPVPTPSPHTPSQTVSVIANRRDIELQKLAAEVQYKELKNAQLEGRLVAREVMTRGVWNPLETFLTRLLSDGAKTIAAKLYPIGQAGGTIEDAEVEARKQITMFIAPLRRSDTLYPIQ